MRKHPGRNLKKRLGRSLWRNRQGNTRKNLQKLRELIELLRENGIGVSTVSGGSTGTAAIKAQDTVYTELQAGSYLFMDTTYGALDLPFENSLFVLATVVSKKGNMVILNEEHLKLFDSGWDLAVGEKAFVIPGHCCSTVNLYDDLYLFRDGAVTERIPVTARGKSQ